MTNKNYQELIKDRIFIGGVNDVEDVLENEKVDTVFDLRAEAPKNDVTYNRYHVPIVDDADQQEESVKKAINEVMDAYKSGKKIYFHCGGGGNRAGTVAIGTLLSLGQAASVDEAEEMAKAIRPRIKVKPELKEALQKIFPNK
ncbi:protein-tyrosine phosphatase family protein [Peribacillus alkalitolerans]|uniref:protein-tyrosine phosphatase family protein n=1 Tax=Peribacillus alkalitolerans TaxID=1550385 RepID=UPI0013D4838E|nr:dual specificity protein phosphatase family protein [Peribacillus alkalitolerans]